MSPMQVVKVGIKRLNKCLPKIVRPQCQVNDDLWIRSGQRNNKQNHYFKKYINGYIMENIVLGFVYARKLVQCVYTVNFYIS